MTEESSFYTYFLNKTNKHIIVWFKLTVTVLALYSFFGRGKITMHLIHPHFFTCLTLFDVTLITYSELEGGGGYFAASIDRDFKLVTMFIFEFGIKVTSGTMPAF